MRLEKHFARGFRWEFEPEERADAGEVQAEVDGGHADVAAGGVHYAVVVGEGEGAGAALGGLGC